MSRTTLRKDAGTDLTSGPILKTLIAFAVPIVFTSIIQMLYGMVDLIIIGQYCGSAGTVGVSTGGEISDLMTPIASAFSTAGQIYIAQLAGAKDQRRIKETVGTLITFMMAISAIAMVGTALLHNNILQWLNCPQEALVQAKDYMLITAIGMPFVFGYNAICSVLRGMGESKRPLIFVIVAASVNIVTDWLFVAVFHWEAAGAAIATVASQIGSCVAAFVFLYKKREQFDFKLSFSYFRIKKEPLKVILKLGLPMLLRIIAVQYSQLWVKSHINAYGLVVSATNSVGSKIERFINIFTTGVDGAAGAMIGQNLGARKYDRVKEIVFTTLKATMLLALGSTCVALLFSRPLFRIFTKDADVIQFGVTYMRIMVASYFCASFCNAFKAVVTGAGEVRLGLFVGILDGVICRIGISLICLYLFHLDALSFFWGSSLAQLIPGFVCLYYYASGKWKTKKLLSEG